MPLFLCRALLSVPTSTSHLLSDTASVEQAALSSLYVPLMCCFEWFVCQKRCWLVVWMKVGLSSINSPTQASKALLFTRATATVDAIVPFKVPLTSVRLKYKWFVQSTLHQEISHCHVAMLPNVLQGALRCLSCALSVCYVFFFEHGRTLVERVALESRYLSNVSLNLIERISTKDLACFLECPCFFPMFILTLPT